MRSSTLRPDVRFIAGTEFAGSGFRVSGGWAVEVLSAQQVSMFTHGVCLYFGAGGSVREVAFRSSE